jgi:Tfp pilus assembly protein PilE
MRSKSGMTILELMIALVILMVVVYALINFFSSNLKLNIRQQEKAKLYYKAQTELEKIISTDFGSSKLSTLYNKDNNKTFIEDFPYLIKITVQDFDPKTAVITDPYPSTNIEQKLLKKITITVADLKVPEAHDQVTLVYFKSP